MVALEALFFFLISLAVGSAVIAWLDPRSKLEPLEFLFGALISGPALFGFLVLGIALVGRDLRAGLTLGYGIGLVFSFLSWRNIKARLAQAFPLRIRFGWWQPLLFLMFLAYLGILFLVMVWDAGGFPRSILVGWGDGAYHLDIISRLRTANPFRLEQPIAVGEPLTYPLMIDFLSALLKKIGAGAAWAWHLPVFLLGSSLFWLSYLFGKRVLGSGSWAAAFLFLIFFGAGLGFLWFFQDVAHGWDNGGSGGAWDVILHPPHEYTHLDTRTGGKPANFDLPQNIVWMVPMVSFFSHQRSFILGGGLSFLFLLGYWLYRRDNHVFPWWLGLLGFLPFSHTHSFFSMGLIAGALFLGELLQEKKITWEKVAPWVKGGALALLLALPQVLFLLQAGGGKEGGSGFFRPWFGWMTCTHSGSWWRCDSGVPGTDANPLFFWMKNFGAVFLFWILSLLYFWRKKMPKEITQFILPSIAMFSVPNLFLLQPWEFDNNKAFFYWWALASLLILAFFKEWGRNMRSRARFLPFLFGLFLILSGLSGTIDVFSRLNNGFGFSGKPAEPTHYGFFREDEREIAQWIQERTSPNDGFLTSDAANQFIPMLTGRPIYLGFTGWLWTQGRGHVVSEREERIRRFLSTRDSSGLCEDGVRYWIGEPGFFQKYGPLPAGTRESSYGEVVFRHPSGKTIIRLPCGS